MAMEYIESSTLTKFKKLDGFASEASTRAITQNKFTILSGIMCIILMISIYIAQSELNFKIFASIIIGFIILTILTRQMIVAERSLQELRFLTKENLKIDEHGGLNVTLSERADIAKFVIQSEKFMILYVLVKSINWIVFLVCSISLVFQITHAIMLLS